MKKLIISIIAVFLAFNLAAQEQSQKRLDSILTYISLDDNSIDVYREIFFYYENGSKMKECHSRSKVESSSDLDNTDWIRQLRSEYIYDSYGNLVEQICFKPRGFCIFGLALRNREIFEYDQNNNLTNWQEFENEVGCSENISDAIWTAKYSKEFEYDDHGNGKYVLKYHFNNEHQEWQYESRITKEYNSAGQIILDKVQLWNNQNYEWHDPSILYEYDYDSTGSLILYKKSFCTLDDEIWHQITKKTYSCDASGDRLLKLVFDWDSIANQWELYSESDYYYSSLGTGIEYAQHEDVRIYPKPTSNIINITGLTQPAELKLYSIQGRLVKTESQVESSVDISDLPAGVYILNLISGNQVLRKRIVKR